MQSQEKRPFSIVVEYQAVVQFQGTCSPNSLINHTWGGVKTYWDNIWIHLGEHPSINRLFYGIESTRLLAHNHINFTVASLPQRVAAAVAPQHQVDPLAPSAVVVAEALFILFLSFSFPIKPIYPHI